MDGGGDDDDDEDKISTGKCMAKRRTFVLAHATKACGGVEVELC
jgi:hypothetical protein